MKPSPEAACRLRLAVGTSISPFDMDADELMGDTDCPHACQVEPDGTCSHGFQSAALTAGVI